MESVPELLARRAKIIEELKRIDEALELLKDSTSPVKIGTRRNLRNSRLAGVTVYESSELLRPQDESAHEGYIYKADLAQLRLEEGDDEGETWWVESD